MKSKTLLCAVMLAALAVAGCCGPAGQPPAATAGQAATATVQPTASVEPTVVTDTGGEAGLPEVVESGELHTPKKGSKERDALMDAARKRLNTSSKFVVYQLKSDHAWAIGELAPADGGKTRFVAFRNEVEGGWSAIWKGTTGGTKDVRGADPRFPLKVIKAIDWEGTPSDAEIVAAARRLAPENGSAPVTGAKLMARVQDSKGRWWAKVSIDNNVDGGVIVIYRDGGKWKCETFGTSGEVIVPGGPDWSW